MVAEEQDKGRIEELFLDLIQLSCDVFHDIREVACDAFRDELVKYGLTVYSESRAD